MLTEKAPRKISEAEANVAELQIFLRFDMLQQTREIYVPEAKNPVYTHVK